MTHGKYAFLALGRAPKGCGYVYRLLHQFRRHVEAEIVDRFGEISTFHAALVQSATRHEGRAQLLTRWLREADGKLKLLERLAVLREIGAATDSRDRCLRLLELDSRRDSDPWAALDAEFGRHSDSDAVGDDRPADGDSGSLEADNR